jgi:hypothetical protein
MGNSEARYILRTEGGGDLQRQKLLLLRRSPGRLVLLAKR